MACHLVKSINFTKNLSSSEMKKYTSIGRLLKDYRNHKKVSQSDLAAKFDVDVRTIIRWEKNDTLLKPEKEEEMIAITFIPYQVIRNLNTPFPIPTSYDFNLRKYSLSAISRELPDADWIKSRIDKTTNRIKTIKENGDVENIIRFSKLQRNPLKTFNKNLILEATKLLPELNTIIIDESGNYSGHCVYFPISLITFNKIKSRAINESELSVEDLVDYKNQKVPVFYCYSITADYNENFFYIIGSALKFFRDTPLNDYVHASLTTRNDSYNINEQLGVDLIWEDFEMQLELNLRDAPRLYEGNFKKFLE